MNELINITTAILMLAIATICDLRTRTINDIIWVIFSTFGLVIVILLGDFGIRYVITVGICISLAIFCKIIKIIATADVLCITVLSLIIPRFMQVEFMPLILTINAFIITAFYVIIINLVFNLKEITSSKFFYDVDESIIKKTIALFCIHRKRMFEKFTFPSVLEINGKKKFLFTHNPDVQSINAHTDYVSLAIPLTPFLLTSTLLTSILIWSEIYDFVLFIKL